VGIDDYRAARALIEQNAGVAEPDFMDERPDALVDAAEYALGVRFPPSYRAFVKELGAGDALGEEFYGVIDDNFTSSTVPNGIWLTLKHRDTSQLPDELVIVYGEGDGTYLALDTARRDAAGESPVVAWIPGASEPGEQLEEVAPDFGTLFRERIQQGLADAGVDT
jgi:hypothetical protein